MKSLTYKITIVQQLLFLLPFIAINSIFVFFLLYKFGWTAATWVAIGFLCIVSIIPTLVLYIQYLIKNIGLTVNLNIDERTICFIQKGNKSKYFFNEISELIRTSSYGRGSWYSFGNYRFYKIIFKDHSEFIITSLLIKNIEEDLANKLNCQEEKKLKVLALI